MGNKNHKNNIYIYMQASLLFYRFRMGQDSSVRKWPPMDWIIPIWSWEEGNCSEI